MDGDPPSSLRSTSYPANHPRNALLDSSKLIIDARDLAGPHFSEMNKLYEFFRGRDSLHRVSKIVEGTRINLILTYNTEPGVRLRLHAEKVFHGDGVIIVGSLG